MSYFVRREGESRWHAYRNCSGRPRGGKVEWSPQTPSDLCFECESLRNAGAGEPFHLPELYLEFHGRVLEHLGIQMYQSAVNAIAELVANAWDADATTVDIELPASLGPNAVIVVRDDGLGMTLADCQKLYLQVGRNRRGNNPDERTENDRPVLGRKGIGKFAGFGIAKRITVETRSKKSGERTVFELNLEELLTDEYIATNGKLIKVLEHEPGGDNLAHGHGTTVTLSELTLKRNPSRDQFARSMARRFLLHQAQGGFTVRVNGEPLPESMDIANAEFVFPRDYEYDEMSPNLTIDGDGWGTETLPDGHTIRWRFIFYNKTIDEEELRGIAVYAKTKLVQRPFLFNITEGLTGQHGVEYLAGQVQADYIDLLPRDLVATERQRVDWEAEETQSLIEWGQRRLREVLRIWAKRRAAKRTSQLEAKVSGFSDRLERLGKLEAKTIRRALTKLAQIQTLDDEQFQDLGHALLTAFEEGRLKELVSELADAEELNEAKLVEILAEADVLAALNIAEAIKAKLVVVDGLKKRIERRELELAVRDYIAKHPWLISPEWETFRVETSVRRLVEEAAKTAELTAEKYKGRVDLVLSSGVHLLILEFVRPGLAVDWDHLNRFDRYVRTIRSKVKANTAGPFRHVSGYLVADRLEDDPVIFDKLMSLQLEDMYAMDWNQLLGKAISGFRQFLKALSMRRPDDFRLNRIAEEAGVDEPSVEPVEIPEVPAGG